MNLNDYISLGIGFIAPLLVSAARGKKWSDLQVMLLIFLVAAGLSAGALYLTNSFTSDNLKDSIALILSTMFPTYTLLWEKTGLNKTLKAWNPLSTKPKRKKRPTLAKRAHSPENTTGATGEGH